MINTNLIKSILNSYSIQKAIYIDEKTFSAFIICDMQEELSLSMWDNLENHLYEQTNKKVALLPLEQLEMIFDKEYLSKGVVIE